MKKYLNLKSLIIGSLLCIGLIVMYAKFIFSPQEYIQSIQMRALGTVFAAAKNTNAKEAQEIVDQLIHATHTGKGTCIRYASLKHMPPKYVEEQYQHMIQDLLDADLSIEFVLAMDLFFTWNIDYERNHHSDPMKDFLALVDLTPFSLDRIFIAFNYDRFAHLLTETWNKNTKTSYSTKKRIRKAKNLISKDKMSQLKKIRDRYFVFFIPSHLIQVFKRMQVHASKHKLDSITKRIQQWKSDFQTPPKSLKEILYDQESSESITDAWNMEFKFEINEHQQVTIQSLGADFKEGGLKENQDLISIIDFPREPPQASRVQFTLDRQVFDHKIKNIDKLITQARFIPHYQNGRILGFKVFGIRPKSILLQLGFKSGDLFIAINEHTLNSMDQFLKTFDVIKGQNPINVSFKRKNKLLIHEITLTNTKETKKSKEVRKYRKKQ